MVVNKQRQFEYDPNKNTTNLAKGDRCDIDYALRVWDDPERVAFKAKTVDDEERSAMFGKIDGRIWMVIFTMRGEVIRIVTWRPAKRKERGLYEQSKIEK